MYLKNLKFLGVGPLRECVVSPSFTDAGDPKPVVLVGQNGSGKTIFLAHVVDALFQFASQSFTDILPSNGIGGRLYYKLLGGRTRTHGVQESLCFLLFQHEKREYRYLETTGIATLRRAQEFSGDTLSGLMWNLQGENLVKTVSPDEEGFGKVFSTGVHAFFPVSRNEYPHWFNREAVTQDRFSLRPKSMGLLERPIVVEASAAENKAWLLDVYADALNARNFSVIKQLNEIVQTILGEESAQFEMLGRNAGARLPLVKRTDLGLTELLLADIDQLSTGQSTLFNLFCTIARYADTGTSFEFASANGLVLIDEADAHLHTRLQIDVLPRLIKLFPKIQFIVTAHSPLFLLGMDRHFGSEGFDVVELPSGNKLEVKSYEEYGEALRAFELIKTVAESGQKCVVLVEGPSDKLILEAAWKALRSSPCPYDVVDSFDCFFIVNTLLREKVLSKNPDRTFVGLLDFDDAFESWERVSRNKSWERDASSTELTGLRLIHRTKPAHLMLLPVPQRLGKYASEAFGKRSCVSIELLFPDDLLQPYLSRESQPGGGMTVTFRDDKKMEFASMVSRLPPTKFADFDLLLQELEKLCVAPTRSQSQI